MADTSREIVSSARKKTDEILCKESDACFNSEEWMELVKADGVRFEDEEKVGWGMAAVLRGAKDAYTRYHILLSFFLF